MDSSSATVLESTDAQQPARSEPVTAPPRLNRLRPLEPAEPIPSWEFLQSQAGRFHPTLRWGSRR
jgi:hypothetical protein